MNCDLQNSAALGLELASGPDESSDFEVHPIGTARELGALRKLHDEMMRIEEGEEFEILSAALVRRAQADAQSFRRAIDGT